MRQRIPSAIRVGTLAIVLAMVSALGFDVDAGVWPTGPYSEAVVGGASGQAAPLAVEVMPVRPSFAIDEPIRFRLHANRTFFLYLFQIVEGGQTVLLLPTDNMRRNRFRGRTSFVVPPDGSTEAWLKFDSAGQKTLALVASTRELPVASNWYRLGAQHHAEALGREWATKRRCKDSATNGSGELFLVCLQIYVVKDRQPVDLWLTTQGNRFEYAVGERIEIVLGAGSDGWIGLYAEVPGIGCSWLATRKVSGGGSVFWNGAAGRPGGEQEFVVAYSKTEPSSPLLSGADAKRCEGMGLPVVAYPFRVVE